MFKGKNIKSILSEETVVKIESARKEMKTEWVSHQDIVKEFVTHV